MKQSDLNELSGASDLEASFDYHFRVVAPDLPKPEVEYRFHETRKWRVDRAWLPHQVAVEIEGGAWGRLVKCHNCNETVRARKGDGSPGRVIRVGGGHQTGRYQTDLEKYNTLSAEGWILLRFSNDQINGSPFEMVQEIRAALETREYRCSMIEALSPRQTDVLYLISAGMKTSEIASRLGVKETSIRKSIQVMCDKLVVHNRAAAVARGIAWGMIELKNIPWTADLKI